MRNDLIEDFKQIKLLSDDALLANINTLIGKKHSLSTDEFFNYIEEQVFDAEDRENYFDLLQRKLVSYNFCPSDRKRSEAILTILSNI